MARGKGFLDSSRLVVAFFPVFAMTIGLGQWTTSSQQITLKLRFSKVQIILPSVPFSHDIV